MLDAKINGFDKWKVENDADTLINAEKIKGDTRKGYLNTVLKEVAKKVKEAKNALLAAKTASNLKKVFGDKK